MKLAYYVRGLGTGIVIAALLLGIYSGFGHKEEPTDLEIMKKAEELGMIKKEDTLNLDSLTPKSTDKPQESNTDQPTKNPAKTDPTAKPSEQPKQVTPKPTQQPAKVNSDGTSHKLENSIHKIYLPQGLNSKDIAADLEDWKVIDSAEEFDRYLTASGFDRKISYGNFTIPSGSSHENIAKILTRPDQ